MPDPWTTWIDALADFGRDFRIVLFGHTRVRADWRISPRRLDDHLVYFVAEGGVAGEVAGRELGLSAGECLWLHPGIAHAFAARDPARPPRLFHLRFVVALDGALPAPVQHFPAATSLRAAFEGLIDEFRTDLIHRERRFRLLLAALFCDLHRSRVDARGGTAVLDEAKRRRLAALVGANRGAGWEPADLARELGYSPAYFARIFKATFGMPPRTWLVHERMKNAAHLLAEGEDPIKEVAAAVGYEDLFLFSRMFKQVHGCSPRAYRRRRVAARWM